jgi:hypothetical protein
MLGSTRKTNKIFNPLREKYLANKTYHPHKTDFSPYQKNDLAVKIYHPYTMGFGQCRARNRIYKGSLEKAVLIFALVLWLVK